MNRVDNRDFSTLTKQFCYRRAVLKNHITLENT